MTHLGEHLTDARAQELVDGVLRGPEAAEAALHAAACPGCSALVESYRALSAALNELPGPDLPADFTSSVLARLEQRESAAARERWAAAAILCAALAALAAALLLGGNGAWAAARLAVRLEVAVRVLHLGAEVFLPLMIALRFPIALACAALALPLLFGLSRLSRPPRAGAA